MATLSVTAADVALVQVIEKFTGPAAEAIAAGQYVRLDTSTGKIALGNGTICRRSAQGRHCHHFSACGHDRDRRPQGHRRSR